VAREWEKKDRRVRYICNDRHCNIAATSNFGLRNAQGEYAAILDDDDWWASKVKLEKQVEFLEGNPEYVGCGGGYIIIDEQGKKGDQVLKPEQDESIKRHALLANPMANSTTMFRMNAAKEVGWYDETLEKFADWDFWLKMGTIGKLYNFPEYFTYYSMWSGGASFTSQKKNARSAMRIVRRHRHEYRGFLAAFLMASLYYTYAIFPQSIKRIANPLLSSVKKRIFSKRKK
jgi:glycosyltransferase involved in cell wall biosynthesis